MMKRLEKHTMGFSGSISSMTLKSWIVVVLAAIAAIYLRIAVWPSAKSRLPLRRVDWQDIVKTDFRLIQALRSNHQPFIVSNVPVVPDTAFSELIKEIARSHTLTLKVSQKSLFSHFSTDRFWSPLLLDSRPHTVTTVEDYLTDRPCDGNYTLIDALRPSAPTGRACFVYSSFSAMMPYLDRLAPALAPIVSHMHQQGASCGSSLWLGSEGVEADWHYDNLDNLLLQLTGTKVMQLLPPEPCSNLSTFSSLHPYHRQAVLRGRCSGWTVEMSPGDMVYLPAGTWHSVLTGPDSLSVNLWMQSPHIMLQGQLLGLSLPISAQQTAGQRLSVLGVVSRLVCQMSSLSSSCLANRMMERLLLGMGVDSTNTVHPSQQICSADDISKAQTSPRSKRAALELFAVMEQQAIQRTSTELTWLAVADFMEDALRKACTGDVGDGEEEDDQPTGQDAAEVVNFSPASVRSVLQQCFLFD